MTPAPKKSSSFSRSKSISRDFGRGEKRVPSISLQNMTSCLAIGLSECLPCESCAYTIDSIPLVRAFGCVLSSKRPSLVFVLLLEKWDNKDYFVFALLYFVNRLEYCWAVWAVTNSVGRKSHEANLHRQRFAVWV